MKRAGSFPIENLSDATWARIEQAVFAELDSSTDGAERAPRSSGWRRWPVLAAALAGVAAAALVVLTRSVDDTPAARTLRLVARAQETTTVLGDIELELEPGAALVVAEQPGVRSLVVLERGAARFSVAPRRARPAFVVQAGEVHVEVVGTRFRVERIGDSARVHTYEGVVRVTASGVSRLLPRDQTWPPPTAAAASAAPVPRVEPPLPAASAQRAPALPRAERTRRAFERAAELEVRDPESALRIYRQLAKANDGWGANALYAMGRLELERGNPARARELLMRYLDRFPSGANASDARALVARRGE